MPDPPSTTVIPDRGSPGTARPASATDVPMAHSAPTTEVSYRGHSFTVPASWPVIDLHKQPSACIRFDRHAVYLGTPSTQQACPATAAGRTEALVLGPAEHPAPKASTLFDGASHTYRATADRLSVTATYGTDRPQIESILHSASLPTAHTAAAARTLSAQALPEDATQYRGRGFDTCAAPSSGAMRAWRGTSGYGAVGVYIGGANRACGQENLTASWVRAQYDAGWRFMPIYVGLQVSSSSCPGCAAITDPQPQGAEAARDAASRARTLGFGRGSVLYFDMEPYARSGVNTATALAFFDSWTRTLHALGYRSAVYGSTGSVMADLVAHAHGPFATPDVIFPAHWQTPADTRDPGIPAGLWADHQRVKQYRGGHVESHGGVRINIDNDMLDVGGGIGHGSPTAPQRPVKKATRLTYTGRAVIADGSPAMLSATLTDLSGEPVAGRRVSLTLGSGNSAQTCAATTNAQGKATCTLSSVHQGLNSTATVPLTAAFAGDERFTASRASATLRLQYMTARAFGLSTRTSLPGVPATAPAPDTGAIRTAQAATVAPACRAAIRTLALSADSLCPRVTTRTGPGGATATSNVAGVRVGVAGLPLVRISGVTATSASNCAGTTGSARLTVTVAGLPIRVSTAPNSTVGLGLGLKLVVNEEIRSGGGLTVNGAHLTAPGGLDLVIASATSAIHNCP